MKADPCGGYTEQVRARFGWKTRSQLAAEKASPDRRCGTCHFRHLKKINKADGGVDFSPYCGHQQASGEEGFATRESSCCDKWERRP